MGKLSKQTFKHFVESECERRLFLDLGEDDPRWLAPLRPLAPRPPSAYRQSHQYLSLGQEFEQQVYRGLASASGGCVRGDRSPAGRFHSVALTPDALASLLPSFDEHGRLCLIEHEFEVPDSWPRALFDLAMDDPVPVTEMARGMRPDLLIAARADELAQISGQPPGQSPIVRLLPDGSTAPLGTEALAELVALRIIDVKHTHEQQVGPSHLVELLVYAHALVAFLHHHGLDDRFCVPTVGHGILHQMASEDAWVGFSLAAIDDFIAPLSWSSTAHLYTRIGERMRALLRAGPQAVSVLEVNIQAGCGYCPFLEDCKQSLGMDSADASTWDVRLLPYTSRSIGQQLRAQGIATVGQVVTDLPDVPPSPTPQPLDAERPVVMLKAHALLHSKAVPSQPAYTGGEQHLTVALPRYSHIELVFDVETDPTHNAVFAAGVELVLRSDSRLSWASHFNAWWAFWQRALTDEVAARALDWSALAAVLDERAADLEFDNSAKEAGKRAETRARHLRREGQALLRALTSLAADPQTELTVALAGSEAPWGVRETAEVRITWSYVSDRPSVAAEAALVRQLVQRLYEMLSICRATEAFTRAYCQRVTVDPDTGNERVNVWTEGPWFAGFYWSAEQLAHIEELLERHVLTLIQDDQMRGYLMELLSWVAPAQSSVAHPLRHKKVFDLRTFAETSLGLPRVINYSWHELAADEFSQRFSRRFWAPHFNYMDFAPWHQMVADDNINTKVPRIGEIHEQLRIKVRSIHRLLRWLRKTGSELFSKGTRFPERTSSLRTDKALVRVHPLARAWHTYARLNATTAELTVDALLSTYPSYSIGKLAAGRVSALRIADPETLSFELHGLSTNIKMQVGSYVLLIPESMRDRSSARLAHRWRIRIDAMNWRKRDRAYEVRASSGTWRKHELFTDREASLDGEPWYVFGTTSDQWSTKLNKLFGRVNFGSSWLGHWLSTLLAVGSARPLERPSSWRFGAPEMYLYAPGLLPKQRLDERSEAAVELATDIAPHPDDSQQAAIHFALARTVSCIKGPPGTGKSQTIAALIDEFLHRRGDRPSKILVTAFAYAALEVVCEKVVTSARPDGSPTRAAKLRALFARSGSRAPLPTVQMHSGVDDLVTTTREMVLNGNQLSRRGKRLEDHVGDSFILFANAHQLVNLSGRSSSKKWTYELIGNNFGFDLIIIDEASQLPADHLLSSLALVKPHSFELACDVAAWPTSSTLGLRSLRTVELPAPEDLTQLVIVGDDQQLPPVQKIEPPDKLRRVLGSAFTYFVDSHEIEQRQLQVNYRSLPEIVAFTSLLGLYKHSIASFHGQNPGQLTRLGPVAGDIEPGWCRRVLAPEFIVGALIHERAYDTAVSPLEASAVATLVAAYLQHLDIRDADAERRLWREELGIVSPHNAHGRLLVRTIADRLTRTDERGVRLTSLPDDELIAALMATIYSVERFQGSDRTFIIASMGISSTDQLAAEERFIYDSNRFNVLTSRAKQKMLLVCSQNFLDHVPRERAVMASAAHIRRYALDYCSEHQTVAVTDEHGRPETLSLRRLPGDALAVGSESVAAVSAPVASAEGPLLSAILAADGALGQEQLRARCTGDWHQQWASFARASARDDRIIRLGRHREAVWLSRERALAALAQVLSRDEAPAAPETVCRAAGLRADIWPHVVADLRALRLWPKLGLVKPPRA